MNILTVSGAVVFFVWAYIMFLRPKVLAAFPKLQAIELKLWAGSRQVLVGNVVALGGLFVGFHDFMAASGADPATLLNEIAKYVPDQYRSLVLAGVLFFGGIILSKLRKMTEGPVGTSLPSRPGE